MIYLLFMPIAIQALAMFFDEFYYHWKRGLPKWEQVGHPVDTTSVLLCFGMTVFSEFSIENLAIYIGFAVFSSLLITKDEFVHAEHCEPGEAWLHSVLFVLHPMVLLAMAYAWFLSNTAVLHWPVAFTNSLGVGPSQLRFFLQTQFAVIFLFFIYQIVYWRYYDKRNSD